MSARVTAEPLLARAVGPGRRGGLDPSRASDAGFAVGDVGPSHATAGGAADTTNGDGAAGGAIVGAALLDRDPAPGRTSAPRIEMHPAARGTWIELAAALSDPPALRVALVRNGFLAGFAKLALATGSAYPAGTATRERLHVRAEIPADARRTLAARVAESRVGIAAADGAADWRPAERVAEPVPAVTAAELGDRVAEAGWPHVTSRADGIAVDLGLDHPAARAVVGLGMAGSVRAAVTLATFAAPADACGAALAVFLLRAAAVVRMARPVLAEHGPWTSAAFEVVYATAPDATELGHALSALRVAAAMTSREVDVLARDADVARAYLARSRAGTLADHASATTTSAMLEGGEA